ncbi:hypothetical protein LSCM1_07406 [Leishmania martiniquensis]|uniref:EGF-like domain-containing protein n=1 Tax=Leishmania martiniquensis TaxID=1580590 RepID=A0A836GSP1_9TRYP|nr:hypothetical protein LSCM1_07406 [Leishmania martiniquensis]
MAAFAPRFYALPLLCAVLVLAAVLARGDGSIVTGDLTMTQPSFDGYTMNLDLSESTASVVTVQLMNSQVSGGGLAVCGPSTSSYTSQARLSMSVVSATVTEATIFFSGVMPTNADIRIVSTTGTLASDQSLFDFSGLTLDGNVTLTVEDTAVTWPKGAEEPGSVVFIGAGSNKMVIQNKAALFVLNANAINGASVLRINTHSPFILSSGAVLAIDYSRCDKCTNALVDIQDSLTLRGSSLFRVANCNVVESTACLLAMSSVEVDSASAYLIHSSTVISGSLFAASEDMPFTVSDNSIVSFLDLKGTATGVLSSAKVPGTVTDSKVMGGGCNIGNVDLTVEDDYQNNGLNVDTIVDRQGLNGNQCANAKCVPGNIESSEHSTTPCTCKCAAGYKLPYCTFVVDPTQNYEGQVDCILPNCETCDRTNPSTRCTTCKEGYIITNEYTCESTAAATTTFTTKAPSSATGTHTAVLAAAVCIAATLNAL